MSFCLTIQPLLAQTAFIQADPNAPASHRPEVGEAGNGTPLIAIAAPNVSGLSYNKYRRFDALPSGVVLNNATAALSRSQLGGLIQGNPALIKGRPAKVILNEVTGANRSVLQGPVEVHGAAADVIIANPFGMTCQGCGFINVPRATLTTGKPWFGDGGGLAGLKVERGDITIDGAGAHSGQAAIFDLISRAIALNGPVVSEGLLRLTAGRNFQDYASGLITPLPPEEDESSAASSGVAISASVLGGVQADQIRLLSTGDGLGVRMDGQMAASAGGMTLTADGKLILNHARAGTTISVTSRKGAVEVGGDIYAGEKAVFDAETAVMLADDAYVAAGSDLSFDAPLVSVGQGALAAAGVDDAGLQTATGILAIEAGALESDGGQISAGALLDIRAGVVDLRSASDSPEGGLRALGDISVAADAIAADGAITALGNIVMQAGDTLHIGQNGNVSAGDGISLAAQSLSNDGEIMAQSALEAIVGDSLANTGSITSLQEMRLTGPDGKSMGLLVSGSDSLIKSRNDLSVKAAGLMNMGAIGSAEGVVSVQLSGDLTNTGLLYSGTAGFYAVDGDLANVNADILAGTSLEISGLAGDSAGNVINHSGRIEAIGGDMTIRAASLSNERVPPIIARHVETDTIKPSETVEVTTAVTTEVLDASEDAGNVRAQLLAGGSMTIDVETLVNDYSQLAANGDVTINAVSAVNRGRDLLKTVEVTTVTQKSQRYCASSLFRICLKKKTRRWSETETTTSASVTGAVYGVIEAGGTITGAIEGYLENEAVRADAGPVGFATSENATDFMSATSSPTSLEDMAWGQGLAEPFFQHGRLFRIFAAPEQPFLIETRAEFVDPGRFLGSQYFLQRVDGYDPDKAIKRFGDSYVEKRLIEDQFFAATGRRNFSGPGGENAWMRRLYDKAVEAQSGLKLTFGVALSADQINRLTHDIVWLEQQRINGQEVLVPRLYIARTTKESDSDLRSARIMGGRVRLQAGNLLNAGAVLGSDSLDIAAQMIANDGGLLSSRGDVVLEATEALVNRSGEISGHDISIAAGAVANDTVVWRDVRAGGFQDRPGRTAHIDAEGRLEINAQGELTSHGGRLSSGGDMVLRAGGDIDISAVEVGRLQENGFKGGQSRYASALNTKAELRSGGNLGVTAGGEINLGGVDVRAEGEASFRSRGNLTITPVMNSRDEELKLSLKGRGLLAAKTKIHHQLTETTVVPSTLAARTLVLESEAGDLSVTAAELKSEEETTLQADQGQVALLGDTETAYERKIRRQDGRLWWKQRDRGHEAAQFVPVRLEAGGGLTINAGQGVVIAYQKTDGLTASLDQLGRSPGLRWIADWRNAPAADNIDWIAAENAFNRWDYRSQGLTQAGAALVSLAVAAVTGGAASSLSAQLAGSLGLAADGAMQAALQAGLQNLASRAAVAAVNHRGDLGAILDDLGSSSSIRSLASAAVTAGLTAHLSGALDGLNAHAAGSSPLPAQVARDLRQGLLRATIRAGVSGVIDGEPLGRSLITAIRSEAAQTLGKTVAMEIGAAATAGKLDLAGQLIAHAALGCATGSLAAQDCASGAAGGVIGEGTGLAVRAGMEAFIAGHVADVWTGRLTADELLLELDIMQGHGVDIARLTSGLTVALAGGDVDTAAASGGNAAENNALCGGVCLGLVVLAATYTSWQGHGDPLAGLEKIGAGDDPLSKGLASLNDQAVEWSSANYPELTAAVFSVLDATGQAIDATITIADDLTGNTVSRQWRNLDPRIRNQILGGVKVASIFIPGSSIKTLKYLKNAGNPSPLYIGSHFKHHHKMVSRTSTRLKLMGYDVVRDPSFRAACGKGYCRPDILYRDRNGKLFVLEVKTGKSGLSPRQKEIFPQIEEGSAIPLSDKLEKLGIQTGIPIDQQIYNSGISVRVKRYKGAKK